VKFAAICRDAAQALSNSAMTPSMVLPAPTSQLGSSPRAFPVISSRGLPPR
jgi:hypothetical protein